MLFVFSEIKCVICSVRDQMCCLQCLRSNVSFAVSEMGNHSSEKTQLNSALQLSYDELTTVQTNVAQVSSCLYKFSVDSIYCLHYNQITASKNMFIAY